MPRSVDEWVMELRAVRERIQQRLREVGELSRQLDDIEARIAATKPPSPRPPKKPKKAK